MKTSYIEMNYPTISGKNLPNSLRTFMQNLRLLCKTSTQRVLAFLNEHYSELKASQCYQKSHYCAEFLTMSLQIIRKQEEQWQGGLNPEQFLHSP